MTCLNTVCASQTKTATEQTKKTKAILETEKICN